MTILADPTTRRGRATGRAVPSAWVIGVDTHLDSHTAAVVDELGTVVAQIEVPATPAGHGRLHLWAQTLVPAGRRVLWAVEGTRSHGHGLTRYLQSAGQRVIESPPPVGATRRRGGKSDPIDATHAARTALATDRHAQPRADGTREALRMLLVTRRHDTDIRTATVNLLKSLLLGAGELREILRGRSTVEQVRHLRQLPDPGTDPALDVETRVRIQTLRRHAATITELDTALAANLKQLRTLVKQSCPGLLDLPGVGPVTAATLLTVWSHHGRIHSEAAFAALGGISPLPASSGRVHRHRLNRGGDRALNAAVHTIVTARRRAAHAPTTAYITRRTSEGLSDKEILRCLKRYTIRQLYRFLQANTVTT